MIDAFSPWSLTVFVSGNKKKHSKYDAKIFITITCRQHERESMADVVTIH